MKRTFFTSIAAVILISCSSVSGSGPGSAASGNTPNSGGDMFYEYTSHTTSPAMNLNGSSKIFLAADGKMRKETQMANPASGLIKELDTMDLWKSRDVLVPGAFTNIMERVESGGGFMYAKDVPAQLKQMGCDGFMVKMQEKSKDVASVFELTKTEKRDLPKSLFAIPAGYKEDKTAGF